MPELPEVELTRRTLERWFHGRTVVRVEGEKRAHTFRGAKLRDFEALKGPLERIDRRGKYLMLTFGQGLGLVAHLGMTGKFVKRAKGVSEPFSRARFFLDSGEVIHFRDPRMLGRMEPAPAAGLTKVKAVKKLGLDPLIDGLSPQQLIAAVGASRQELKVALMDQGRIAGLGNIHAAEALFRAKLNPHRAPKSVKPDEWAALAKAITEAIAFALDEQEADELSYVEEPGTENPFLVYGRKGEPCLTCGTAVKSSEQGGRTTYFCPSCQPRRKKR